MTKTDGIASRHWLDSWHVNPSANRDYDFIDGLRGIAILMVLVCHSVSAGLQTGRIQLLIGNYAGGFGRGVMIFFALSGFLISWPFWKRKFAGANSMLPPGYFQRRFWKIYPPLALSVFLLAPAYVYFLKDWSYVKIGAEWLTGLPFLVPVDGKFNPVMWTLVIEVQFYLLLPLVFFLLKPVSGRVCLWVIPAIFLGVPFCFRMATGLVPSFQPVINPHFPAALDVFGLGVLIAGLDNTGVLRKSAARLGVVGLLAWLIGLFAQGWLAGHPQAKSVAVDESLGWLMKAASGCLLLFIANPQHQMARWLCAPWLRWCGIVSYEWYLLHQPMIYFSRIIYGPTHGSLIAYLLIHIVALISVMVLTMAVYKWFSLPILKHGRATAAPK